MSLPRSRESRLEAVTMALYLAIVLLAEAVAMQGYSLDASEAVATYWGSAVGLALAHVYAFSLSTKLLARGRSSPAARWTAAWQMVVAVAVRLLATVPFQLLRESVAFTVSGALLAALIGATGLEAARTGGASVRRAPLVGTTTLIIGR